MIEDNQIYEDPSQSMVNSTIRSVERGTNAVTGDLTRPYPENHAPSEAMVQETIDSIERASTTEKNNFPELIKNYQFTGQIQEEDFLIHAISDIRQLFSYTDLEFQQHFTFVNFWEKSLRQLPYNNQVNFFRNHIDHLISNIQARKMPLTDPLDVEIVDCLQKKLEQ